MKILYSLKMITIWCITVPIFYDLLISVFWHLAPQDNGRLYQNLLELEMSGDLRANGGGVQQCVAKALAAPLSPKTKILFSQRSLQFAEDFGTTVQRSELIFFIIIIYSLQSTCYYYVDSPLIGLLKCYLGVLLVCYQCLEHIWGAPEAAKGTQCKERSREWVSSKNKPFRYLAVWKTF